MFVVVVAASVHVSLHTLTPVSSELFKPRLLALVLTNKSPVVPGVAVNSEERSHNVSVKINKHKKQKEREM